MAMQAKHMCSARSFGSPRLLCNFAQNILDIMSHLREDVCRSSSIYDRTRESWLKGFHRPHDSVRSAKENAKHFQIFMSY